MFAFESFIRLAEAIGEFGVALGHVLEAKEQAGHREKDEG